MTTDTPRTDACPHCGAFLLTHMTKRAARAEAEVERLKEQLKRAVEIADKIWAACSNGSEHTEIAALKGKIK